MYLIRFLLLGMLTLLVGSAVVAQDQNGLQHFDIDSLKSSLEESGKPWLGFFHNDNLTTGIYSLEVGAEDKQSPHDSDEIYYVLEGKGDFTCEDKEVTIETGSILYVPAEASHRFLNITEKLVLLVFFD